MCRLHRYGQKKAVYVYRSVPWTMIGPTFYHFTIYIASTCACLRITSFCACAPVITLSLIGAGTMENKIYELQVSVCRTVLLLAHVLTPPNPGFVGFDNHWQLRKESLSKRIVDDKAIERHFSKECVNAGKFVFSRIT